MLEMFFDVFINTIPFIAYLIIFLAIFFAIVGGFRKSDADKIVAYTLASKTLLIAALLLLVSLTAAIFLGLILRS